MISPSQSQVLSLADLNGWQACAEKTREQRGEKGQFFTPPVIARCLAGWFQPEGFNRRQLHLLDPGAGGGVLTAAWVDRIITLLASGSLPNLEEVNLEVWELDDAFLPGLRRNLSACVTALEQSGIRTTVHLNHGSYIEGAVRALEGGLFESDRQPNLTHAILNPPYRKISSRSRERALLASVGIEISNLYAAFVWLAVRQLDDRGELAAITPRSFCNGPYFREFRRELLESANFCRVHLFDSRLEAFSRDDVLQENILFHLHRDKDENRPLVVSTGSLEDPATAFVPQNRFVSPVDPDQVIHITTDSDAIDVRGFIDSLPCKLLELGIEVSTGPVVDFRLKDSLLSHLATGSVPLIYPHCVKSGRVIAPCLRSTDYGDGRLSKKPVAIHENDETRKWLISAAHFVLIKRFSSKEERRRLVSGVLNPADFPSGLVGIENHLNFFHCKRAGLSAPLARGLSRFLNSTVADRYFRHFNGHTQVNASDLRSFRYPNLSALQRLGEATLDDTQQKLIDLAMTELLGAPSFSDS